MFDVWHVHVKEFVVQLIETWCRGQDAVSSWIEDNLGGGKVVKRQSMGGSGWSSAAVLTTEDGQKFFAKESKGRGIAMFKGEAKGLQALSAAAGAPPLCSQESVSGAGSSKGIPTVCLTAG